jgi:hypothetical protein
MRTEEKDWSLIFISSFCIISTLLILYHVFKFSAYGLDFTDEGYYLNWISNPFLYKTSLSQFGFIYYPLYNLVNENIAWFRRINFLITFGLSFILVYLLINRIVNFQKINKIIQCIISSGIAITSFTYLFIQTPNYNTLNLQALLITCLGVVIINKTSLNKNILGNTIIGLGGWLTFMSKPSSAIGLSLVTLIYLIVSRDFQLRFFFIAIFTSLLLLIISALVIDGSIIAYFNRYFLSLEIHELLQAGQNINSIFRLDPIKSSNKFIISTLLIFVFSTFFIWLGYKNYKLKNFIYIVVCFLIFIVIAFLALGELNWSPGLKAHQPYLVFGIIFSSILSTIIIINKIRISDIHWHFFFLFFTLPYIFALGTANNYWLQSGIAAFFWFVAAFVLIIPLSLNLKQFQLVVVLVLISQLITSIHLKERMEEPYRYNEPLRLGKKTIVTNNKNHTLIISDEFIRYINDARNVSSQSGLQKGDFIIDLSGQSPGLIYLMGAKSLGTAWNTGGYKGSLDAAKAYFNLTNCKDISNAWILYESEGPINISTDLLTSLGMNFPKQYRLVGSWATASGAGGYKQIRIQELYKPLNANIRKASCELIRKKEFLR